MNRRELFRAFLPSSSERKGYIPPPFTEESTNFKACGECEGPCVTECETGVLLRDEEGIPYLSFAEAGCSYCGVCAEVCPQGVISKEKPQRIRAKVKINPSLCGAWNGTLCFSCKEPCIDNAIKFEGIYKPVILESRCTSCGYCVPVCPSHAIEVTGDAT